MEELIGQMDTVGLSELIANEAKRRTRLTFLGPIAIAVALELTFLLIHFRKRIMYKPLAIKVE